MFSNISTERTGRRGASSPAAALALTALALFGSFAQGETQEVNRTRSIYVPVRFQACEHVSNVRLTVTGDPQPFTLGTRIFMFTYYPDRGALLPEFAEVWIEGTASTDEGLHEIRTNVLVTPERIASSQDLLNRGSDEIEKQLRRRRDVRLPEATIQIKCQDSCARAKNEAKSAGEDASEERSDRTTTRGSTFETQR